jgi:hypothetical protein
MSLIAEFEARLPSRLRRKFQSLQKPIDIQRYLDAMPYIGEERDRCPLDVMKDQQCHCLDGGLFAALALRRMREPGLLIDLLPARSASGHKQDDDHVLALFRRNDRWGAIAKSNFPWLKYRDPIYRSIRELVMSYFEVYFTTDGVKVLRAYTRPFHIARYDHLQYAWDEAAAGELYKKFYARKEIPLMSPESEALLEPVDKVEFEAGFLGVNWDWVFRPEE